MEHFKRDAPGHSGTKYPFSACLELEQTCELWIRGFILKMSKLRPRGPKQLVYDLFSS